MMWDEAPGETEGIYQIVRNSIILALVLAILSSLQLDEWEPMKSFGMVALIVGVALCGYALIVRMIASAFRKLTNARVSKCDNGPDQP